MILALNYPIIILFLPFLSMKPVNKEFPRPMQSQKASYWNLSLKTNQSDQQILRFTLSSHYWSPMSKAKKYDKFFMVSTFFEVVLLL